LDRTDDYLGSTAPRLGGVRRSSIRALCATSGGKKEPVSRQKHLVRWRPRIDVVRLISPLTGRPLEVRRPVMTAAGP